MTDKWDIPTKYQPHVHPHVQRQKSLHQHCWFRSGGDADYLVTCHNITELQDIIQSIPDGMPIKTLGAGSNVMISDTGYRGVIILLDGDFKAISHEDHYLSVGAGAHDATIAKYCATHGLSGLEFLIGIPGTMGGGVKMNAGAHQQQISDCITTIDIMDRHGKINHLGKDDLHYAYRTSSLADDMICIGAHFDMVSSTPQKVKGTLKAFIKARHDSQPAGRGTGGSTFKNPITPSAVQSIESSTAQSIEASTVQSAWKLIDEADCRGLQLNDAQISPMHCNFMMNLGNARTQDLYQLGETVRQRVFAKTGTLLEWEIEYIGDLPTSFDAKG